MPKKRRKEFRSQNQSVASKVGAVVEKFVADERGSITKQSAIAIGAVISGAALAGSAFASHSCGGGDGFGGDGGGGGTSGPGGDAQGGKGGEAYGEEASFAESYGPGWTASDQGATYSGDGGGGGGDGGGCFLTTAACSVLGKPDDCAELQALRAFRGDILSGSDEGKLLVGEYYALAPALAAKMKDHPERKRIAQEMFGLYLPKVLAALKGRKLDEAIALYRDMAFYVKSRVEGSPTPNPLSTPASGSA